MSLATVSLLLSPCSSSAHALLGLWPVFLTLPQLHSPPSLLKDLVSLRKIILAYDHVQFTCFNDLAHSYQ